MFVIGGNGGNAAAHAIAEECEAAGVICNVIGVPKSIDNDILLVRAYVLAWACFVVIFGRGGMRCNVIGVPKSIDNDILLVGGGGWVACVLTRAARGARSVMCAHRVLSAACSA